jgi:hypothetical protein
MLLQIKNEPPSFITQEQCEAQAERIAAVLRERKKIGDERRRRELEYQRRNNDRALAHYYKGRGEVSQQPAHHIEKTIAVVPERRIENIDVAYYAVMICRNAAIES